MSQIIERVGQYISTKGLSVRSFEQSIGASNGAIGRAISKNSDIVSSWVSKIIETYPDINTEWLISGKGPMMSADLNEKENLEKSSRKEIPLIPMEAFAGYGVDQFPDVPIEDFYQITEFSHADFLIRIKGDSMTPRFNGGDVVACKKIKETLFFQWNRIYVIYTISQGIMIKRVKPAEDEDYIRLVSDNPRYEPFLVPKKDISDIALVLGAVTLE